jgi:exodeoxyribonuclease V alpha subunit
MKVTLRVATVRKQRPGHTVFTGKAVDREGRIIDARSFYVVNSTRQQLVQTVEAGQWWTFEGPVTSRAVDADGYKLTEHTIEPVAATLERISGEHLIQYLNQSALFTGIGQVKARRLWEAFGDDLYRILDEGDLRALSTVLSRDIASNAIDKWAAAGHGPALKWMQGIGLEVRIGRKVLEFHGSATQAKLQEDPYRLLSFCANWKTVDTLARTTFGVAFDDERRVNGAIEEACYAAFAEGHTAILSAQLQARIGRLLGPYSWPLVHSSLNRGLTNGAFVIGPHGVQPTGAAAMEHTVARLVTNLAQHPAPMVTDAELRSLIANYERDNAIELNPEQHLAVEAVNGERVVLVTGGAGVGKTTVLKAMYRLFDAAGIEVVQMALAGRAAKRMQEATGRPARTIASFIRDTTEGVLLPTVVVIDEASMLDVVSMAAVCERLSSTTRLVLLGDPYQLMPVGPGLILHALAGVPGLPHVELKTVKRYGGAILAAAQAIRAGCWPDLSDDVDQDISFLECSIAKDLMAEVVVDLYDLDPENTQILVSKREGAGGAKSINAEAQRRHTCFRPPVLSEHGESTGLHEGDPVLCTRNMWDRGLQNGSMGSITRVQSTAAELADVMVGATGTVIAWIRWDDGETRPLVDEMLGDITLGYAVTVHKAQGSQWKRVIVPVVDNRMLDRSLLYTALTRAQSQVVLLGDVAAARTAVEKPPRSTTRQVALDLTVQRFLKAIAEESKALLPA